MAELAQKPPKGDVREMGVASYISSRRAELVNIIVLPHGEKDDEIRRLCRLEFKGLSPDEQWHWVRTPPASFVGHDASGRFHAMRHPQVLQ